MRSPPRAELGENLLHRYGVPALRIRNPAVESRMQTRAILIVEIVPERNELDDAAVR